MASEPKELASNQEIAQELRIIAAAYAIKDEKKYKFQIIAYQKAADSVEHATSELRSLWKAGKLDEVPGLGSSLQASITELFETGKVKHFQDLTKDLPEAIIPLLEIPGFGPKKAYRLVEELKLKNPKTVIQDLEKAAKQGKIATMEGFGEKSEQLILDSINSFRKGAVKSARMVLPVASALEEKVLNYLKKSQYVVEVEPLGSMRRMVSTIGDIDFAVATKEPEAVLEYFTKYPETERILEKGPASASILVGGGKHIDLMVQTPENFGSLLQHFTGSKAHNIKLREYALKHNMSLSEYGIKVKGELKHYRTEESFYKALGMQWVPPEIREDMGEIELALKNKLPKLVELKDIKGDFHIHSSYPIEPSHDMGQSSMQVMLDKAKSLGYSFLAFSEHNPNLSKHNDKQIYSILEKRAHFIEALRKGNKNIRVINMLETDILASGDLAMDEKALSFLDATIVSIHSVFSMDQETMTKRIIKGLSNPKAKILAHPTGRLLNERAGYDVNWDVLFKFVKENNKALEINAWPYRLDLADNLVRQAVEMGIKLVIDTDSHEVSQMDLMKFGVAVARRGWATRDDIINTWDVEKVLKWIES